MKIRIGNDFVFNWAIERGGLPEDLSSVLEAKLTASVFGKKQEMPFTVSGNIITIEFTPEICNIIGSYNLLFTYILPDTGLSDDDRKCAVDVDAFKIVAKTAQADDSTEFSMTSDMAIAFKGDKGDSAYHVWLEEGNTGTEEDYFAYLRQPAIDAGASISELEDAIQVSEGLRVEAETLRLQSEGIRISAETERKSNEVDRLINESSRASDELTRKANESTRKQDEATRKTNENERKASELTRQSSESERNEAEGLRVDAESLRVTAENSRGITESLRVEAELLRQTNTQEAISNAENATENANMAAQNADDARNNIMPSVLNNEKVQADIYTQLNARITALEAILSNKIKDRIEVTKQFNVWGKTNLILYGDGANTKAPDFIGQKYIDTADGNVYVAVGTDNAGNWKLV